VLLGRAQAREFAEVFNLTYAEIPGSLEYFRRLACGPWDGTDFLRIVPGTPIDQAPFLGFTSISLP
jgi:hypothetical protein